VAQVCFHRVQRQVQLGCYFGVGDPLGQLFQHAQLSGGQRVNELALPGCGRGASARPDTSGDQCLPLPGPGIQVEVGDDVVDQLRSRVDHGPGETVALGHGQGPPGQRGCVGGGLADGDAGAQQPQLQIRPDRGALRRGALERLGCFRWVPRGKGDDRWHDPAPVIGQPSDDACGTGLVAQVKTQPGFELVSLGQQDGVVAFERRPRGGQRGESLIRVAAGRPDPGPVQLRQIVEGRPGTADDRQRAFDGFGGRSQVASLQREQGRGP
jgi:hypothetical protein